MPISEGPHKGRAGWVQDGVAVTFCYITRTVVPIEQADANRDEFLRQPRRYRDVDAPYTSSDYLPDQFLHPCTGVRTDSKSHFRKMTRASGCVEVGDQAPVKQSITPNLGTKADRVQAIKQAMYQHGVDVL